MKILEISVNAAYCIEHEYIDKFGFARVNKTVKIGKRINLDNGDEESVTFEKMTDPGEEDIENGSDILLMEHWDQTDPDFCHFSALILTDKAFKVHMEESLAELVDYDVMQIEFMPDFNFTVLDDISKMLKRIEPDKFQDKRSSRSAS
ncbi:MAG: hypothetical protein ACAI35_09385 [Candidatus Methylacidiphilales bacterium]|nr:hypothetical protein [Candidatus Methylacidiphilales bacterium]